MKTIEQLENWYHNQSNIEKDFGVDGVEAYNDINYSMTLSEECVRQQCLAWWPAENDWKTDSFPDRKYRGAIGKIYEFLIGE